jgi:BASS family bile acid:Na+ symporter
MAVTQILGPLVLFLLMMIVGLELTTEDFRRVLSTPRAVVGGTLGQWILLPLMTWFVVRVFELPPTFGAGAILVAVSPGAGISNIVVALGRANTALSVTLTATASTFAVITLPTLTSFGMQLFFDEAQPVEVPVGSLIAQLFVAILLPIGLGMALRMHHPERAALLAPRLQRLTVVVIVIVVAVSIATAPEDQLNLEGAQVAMVAAAVWTVLAGALGWGTAAALRLSSEDRFTFLVEFSARNIAVATIVAMSGLQRVDLTFFSGIYAMTGYPLIAMAVVLRRRFAR